MLLYTVLDIIKTNFIKIKTNYKLDVFSFLFLLNIKHFLFWLLENVYRITLYNTSDIWRRVCIT